MKTKRRWSHVIDNFEILIYSTAQQRATTTATTATIIMIIVKWRKKNKYKNWNQRRRKKKTNGNLSAIYSMAISTMTMSYAVKEEKIPPWSLRDEISTSDDVRNRVFINHVTAFPSASNNNFISTPINTAFINTSSLWHPSARFHSWLQASALCDHHYYRWCCCGCCCCCALNVALVGIFVWKHSPVEFLGWAASNLQRWWSWRERAVATPTPSRDGAERNRPESSAERQINQTDCGNSNIAITNGACPFETSRIIKHPFSFYSLTGRPARARAPPRQLRPRRRRRRRRWRRRWRWRWGWRRRRSLWRVILLNFSRFFFFFFQNIFGPEYEPRPCTRPLV